MQAIMPIVDHYLLPLSLWLVMFAMGLSLVPADFRRILDNRRAYYLGMLSMLLIVPAVGVAIATSFAPTPALMMGFILLATCPGGLLSNLLTSLSRGDLALSVSLSLSTSVIYIFTLPFIAHYGVQFVFSESRDIAVPFGSSIWEILRVTVFPIACGMIARAWRPQLSLAALPYIKQGSTIALCIIFGLIVVDNLNTLRSSFGIVLGMVVGMNAANLTLALLLSRIGRVSREERIAITIEHLIRQEATAIYVAVTILGRTDMSLPMIINTFVGMFACVIFVGVMKRRRAREASVPQTAT
ncbi:MAG TPA: bile acid:sodium symporter [Steroidobacteraceae bacterium]|nr:bile acid:sodium symporter [Steroidobacteraceae bacterium]